VTPTESVFDFRGLAGQVLETPFREAGLPSTIYKKLKHDRYAWLITVDPTGVPLPMLVWFGFDGNRLTVYSQPRTSLVTHVFEHPSVSLHLESDGVGSGLIIVGGTAAVTAEAVDPREDTIYWAKYHVEAQALGMTAAIASYSARITITPTTLWTTYAA
jgi:PPOX class probable F420-dependent enzyme